MLSVCPSVRHPRMYAHLRHATPRHATPRHARATPRHGRSACSPEGCSPSCAGAASRPCAMGCPRCAGAAIPSTRPCAGRRGPRCARSARRGRARRRPASPAWTWTRSSRSSPHHRSSPHALHKWTVSAAHTNEEWAAVMMRVRKGWWKERRGVREKGGRFSGRQFAYLAGDAPSDTSDRLHQAARGSAQACLKQASRQTVLPRRSANI